MFVVVGLHVSLALDEDLLAVDEAVGLPVGGAAVGGRSGREQGVLGPLRHLQHVAVARAVHATGHVDRVAPDVEVQLGGPDHTRSHRPVVDAALADVRRLTCTTNQAC